MAFVKRLDKLRELAQAETDIKRLRNITQSILTLTKRWTSILMAEGDAEWERVWRRREPDSPPPPRPGKENLTPPTP